MIPHKRIKPLLPLDEPSSWSPFLRILGSPSVSIPSLHYIHPLFTLPIMLFCYTLLFAMLTTFVVATPIQT